MFSNFVGIHSRFSEKNDALNLYQFLDLFPIYFFSGRCRFFFKSDCHIFLINTCKLEKLKLEVKLGNYLPGLNILYTGENNFVKEFL